jgi:hypothetical protein
LSSVGENTQGDTLRTKDTPDARPLVFLTVLMLHAAIVLLLLRPARLLTNSGTSDEPLILLFLHSRPPPATGVATPRPAPSSNSRSAKREPAPVPDNAITLPPEAPPRPSVDWQREAELAAQSAVADAEKEGKFRNLSSFTPLQLDWIKRNHMEPAPPGIHWKRPRVEITPGGLPIIWINERCALVTLLVFCGIGRIEADGGLFNHMRDPH